MVQKVITVNIKIAWSNSCAAEYGWGDTARLLPLSLSLGSVAVH